MRASTDLWEPWAGNRPGPPGQRRGGIVVALEVATKNGVWNCW